jgi:hypothetical protein
VETWNVLSLYTRSEVLRNLVEVTQEYCIDLLAVQELKWLGKTILEKKNLWCITAVMINNIVLDMGFTVSEHLRIWVMNSNIKILKCVFKNQR